MIETPRFGSLPPAAVDKDHMSVLIAVDTSGSVEGEALRNINENLNNFRQIVCQDPVAARCVDVCVLSFDDEVRVLQDWCPIQDMRRFELASGGFTNLNGAVLTGIQKIRERSRVYREQGIVERKPYLIVMTDGFDTVTGSVDEATRRAGERIVGGKLKLWFLGFGPYDRDTAAKLCHANGDWCFEVRNGDFNFNDFFDFAANSVKAMSVSAPGERVVVNTVVGTPASNVRMRQLPDPVEWLNEQPSPFAAPAFSGQPL